MSYLTEFRGVAASVGAFGVTAASAVAIGSVPIAGRLADRFEPGHVIAGGAVGVAALAFPFFWALDTGSPVLIVVALVLATGVVIPAMLAASGSFFAQQFPTEVRASGLGTGREAGGIGGRLAPLLAVALIAITPGNAAWPVSIMFLVSAVCILLGVLGNQGSKVAARSGGPASDSAGRTESAAPADDKTEDFIGSASR